MATLVDHLGQFFHARQLLESGFQRRQALEVLLAQHRLHVRHIAGTLKHMQPLANALAHLAGLTEHRHRQPLAEQEDRQEDHAKEDQDEFRGDLAHGY
ncbi:hypothetical protein D3C75_862310 [compost metagenome]